MALKRSISLAIMGTRGIPARYGGFETFAEELATRLVARGHQVTVYGRRKFGEKPPSETVWHGVGRIWIPTIRHKYLETPLHGLFSFLEAFRHSYDVVLLCNAANSPFAWLLKIAGNSLLINVDGVERRRAKWNLLGRFWYQLGERCSVLFANRIVADAEVIARYYRETHNAQPALIAYGAEAHFRPAGETLRKLGLTAGAYLLYVSRLEPENNALGVIAAYTGLETAMPLVIVGDAPYASRYIAKLKERANAKVIFAGFQFGEAYQELRSHCYSYIQATEVGGTHPALVEAMAYGNCIVANRVPEHEEVLGEAGLYYPRNDFAALRDLLARLICQPDEVKKFAELARVRAERLYRWEEVVSKYEQLFLEVRKALP